MKVCHVMSVYYYINTLPEEDFHPSGDLRKDYMAYIDMQGKDANIRTDVIDSIKCYLLPFADDKLDDEPNEEDQQELQRKAITSLARLSQSQAQRVNMEAIFRTLTEPLDHIQIFALTRAMEKCSFKITRLEFVVLQVAKTF